MESTPMIKLLKKLPLLCISIIIFVAVFSCDDDSSDDDAILKFIGTWEQTSRTIDNTSLSLDSTRLIMQIESNNICTLYDSTYAAVNTNNVLIRSGWSYNNGLMNIAVDLPASWTVDASENELGMERIDFKQDGAISRTKLNFTRISNIEQE